MRIVCMHACMYMHIYCICKCSICIYLCAYGICVCVGVAGWKDTVLLLTYMNEDSKEAGGLRPPTQQILFYMTISHFTWSLLLLQEDVHRTLLATVYSQENMKDDGKTKKKKSFFR